MLKLLSQRLALGLATLLAVSVLIFCVTELLPRDLAAAILGPEATPESVAAIRVELDLDRPAVERYGAWLRNAAKGDFGRSLANKRQIADVIGPRLGNTLFLAIYAAVVALPLAILLGILAAIYRGSAFDRLVNFGSLAAVSMPEFLIGYVLMLFLSVHLPWFPAIATPKAGLGFVQHLHTIFLPMLTLVLVVVAHMMRTTRGALLAVMASPYIEMAVLKGIPHPRIVIHHALPNALAPIVGAIFVNLGYLIAGVVIVETVFTFNGLGRLMVDAVASHDIPVVQACGLIFAVIFIALKLATDVLSALSDPMLRHAR